MQSSKPIALARGAGEGRGEGVFRKTDFVGSNTSTSRKNYIPRLLPSKPGDLTTDHEYRRVDPDSRL